MTTRWTTSACLLAALACGTLKQPATPPREQVLRVGLSPDAPPVAFREAGGTLAGIEVDLATRLAADLGRPLRFVELDRRDLIPALLNDRIDVVMSGLTVTRARQLRFAFGEGYLETGLTALVRRRDARRFDTPAKVLGTSAMVGVTMGTTAERFARERMPSAPLSLYPRTLDGVTELRQGRIDLFVDDAHILAWYASVYESELAGMWTPMTEGHLAWAFRPSEEALRAAASAALARWRADGTLDGVLRRWLPLWPGLAAPR